MKFANKLAVLALAVASCAALSQAGKHDYEPSFDHGSGGSYSDHDTGYDNYKGGHSGSHGTSHSSGDPYGYPSSGSFDPYANPLAGGHSAGGYGASGGHGIDSYAAGGHGASGNHGVDPYAAGGHGASGSHGVDPYAAGGHGVAGMGGHGDPTHGGMPLKHGRNMISAHVRDWVRSLAQSSRPHLDNIKKDLRHLSKNKQAAQAAMNGQVPPVAVGGHGTSSGAYYPTH